MGDGRGGGKPVQLGRRGVQGIGVAGGAVGWKGGNAA